MAVVMSGAIFRSSEQDLNHGIGVIELRKSKGQFIAGVLAVGLWSDRAEAEDGVTSLWGFVLSTSSGLVPRREYKLVA